MMLGTGVAAAMAGVLLVRLGWGRARRVSVGGWLLTAAALLLLGREAGAWGVSLGAAAASVVALAAIAQAGLAAPAPARIANPRIPPSLPAPPIWPGFGRRCLVFLACVPVAFAAAQWLAFAAHGAARTAGWRAADAIVLAMILQPLAWALIVSVQLTRAGVRRMWTAPAVTAAAGTLLWMAA